MTWDLKRFSYLRILLSFAFRKNPLLYIGLVIAVFSVMVEIAAMATLLPLASMASGGAINGENTAAKALVFIGAEYTANNLFLLFIALFSLRILTHFSSQAMLFLLGRRLFLQINMCAFHSLLGIIPIKSVERVSIGTYITLAGDEAFRASGLITHLSQLLSSALLAGLYFLTIFIFSWQASLALTIFLVVTFVLTFEAFRFSHRLGDLQVEQSKVVGSIFLDALNGLRTVRAFSAEHFVEMSYGHQLKSYMRTLFSIDVVNLLIRQGPALLLFFAAACYVILNPVQLMNSNDFALAVSIVLLLMRFFPVIGQTVSIMLKVISDARSGRDITEFIAREDSLDPFNKKVDRIFQPTIVDVRNVCFSHSAKKLILKDICFKLERGKSYALVGRSGSGKSTLLDLFLRFYDPISGQIYIDGADIGSLDRGQLRQIVLLVSQETTIFNDTFLNNIKFGVLATDEEVIRACRVACIDDLIGLLPHGLETMLSYRGMNLSGGQRQRIGLARALLRSAPVLLLDESTSALDSETRSLVIQRLKVEYQNKILLFVTHDANIINVVDHVLDMAILNQIRPEDELE